MAYLGTYVGSVVCMLKILIYVFVASGAIPLPRARAGRGQAGDSAGDKGKIEGGEPANQKGGGDGPTEGPGGGGNG